MSVMYSTGAVNFRAGGASLREMLSDCALDVYGGTPPASADAAETNTKLCRISVGSGAITSAMRSVPEIYTCVAANRTDTNTIKFTVTLDGVGPTINTYTFAASVDTSDLIAAENLAAWLQNLYPALQCTAYAALSVVVQAKVPGLALVITDGAGSTSNTCTVLQAYSRSGKYTLQFGPPTAGVISKTADVWSGLNLVTGVATHFRFVLPSDDASSSTSQRRVQGTIGTSNAELIMANTSVTAAATTTIDSAAIQELLAAA